MKISAVGDIMLGSHPSNPINGMKKTLSQDNVILHKKNLEKLLNRPDIFIGNLEGPISIFKDKNKEIPFAFNSSFLELIDQAKINLFSLANNHIMQYGYKNFNFTCERLVTNNFFPLGLKVSSKGTIPFEIKIENNHIIFISLSLRPEDTPFEPCYASKKELKLIKDYISKVGNDHFVILSIHWGNEFVDIPSPNQISLGRELVDIGVNVILGHHSHTVMPIEIYNNSIIVYSLGNFISDMQYQKVLNSMCLDMEIKDNNLSHYSAQFLKINNSFPQLTKNKNSDIFFTPNMIDSQLKGVVSKHGSYKKYVEINRFKYRNYLKLYTLNSFYKLKFNEVALIMNNAVKKRFY